ncbi:MAG: DNA-binding protein [Flavobacteriales bacterium]|nr:DNA-binding protein [Flavobacteriales bacterium]MCB9203535.1 DNA-binding protein [Flavobacteriales bacterium]
MKDLGKQLIILDKEDLAEVLESLIRETISREVEKIVFEESSSPLLTRDEVAKMLDISLPTLLQWEKDGVIPKPKRLGKRVYWIRQTFIEFLHSTPLQNSIRPLL